MLMSLMFLVSCSRTYVEEHQERCSPEQVSGHSSFIEGAKDFFAKYMYYFQVDTDLAGKDIGSPRVTSVAISDACRYTACKEGYTKYDSSTGFACVPNPPECKKIGSITKSFNVFMPLSQQYNLVNSEDPSCVEEPFKCGIGYSVNSSDPDNLSCSQTEVPCTGEELEGLHAASGTKTFDTQENEYSACQIASCAVGYNQEANSCVPTNSPIGVLGCTDSRAENFNPLATENDNSCSCGVNQMPYNPMTGCMIAPPPPPMPIVGYMDSRASNFNPLATINSSESCTCSENQQPYNSDTGCVENVYGCTYETANNYNPLANTDDGSCGCDQVDGIPHFFSYAGGICAEVP